MKLHFALIALMLLTSSVNGQTRRPRIGLTLSGGGAKGLAHIGILKAIDSAGLKIDVVTGTSMGSIMGALYATGYSGNEIESIARSIDWGSMFSNKPPLELVNMNEKREFANYALEIPLEKGKAKFYSGFIEAEEIWLRFGELFYPVHNIKDFTKFNIPFSCIATDAATGKAVVLKDGEIVKAVRSSMAIPSIFSAVQYKDTKLVDGGVVRNFPVRDAKAMGADYVVGVNVSEGLASSDKLVSPIDMIYQISFYKDADDFVQEKKLCNLLIEPPLEEFSAASFGSADSIINIGNETGKKYYPYFKRLADSLIAIYPEAKAEKDRLPKSENLILDEIVADGLKYSTKADFDGKMGVELGKSYTGKEIAMAVRKAFSSGNFRRIAFFIDPLPAGHARLRCEVIETLPTYFKVGIHYHTYSDIALITTLATRNLLFNRSKSFVKVNWSDNLRILARHDQAFGKHQRWGTLLSFYHERFKFPIYDNNFELQFEYKSIYSNADLKLYRLLGTTSMVGLGTSHEWLKLNPIISPNLDFVGVNQYWNSYFFFQRNSLDAKVFPRRGSYVDLQVGMIYGQQPNFTFVQNGQAISSDTLNLEFNAYEQIKLKMGRYFPLWRRWTLIAQFNNGVNLNYKESFLNFYSVGGINDFIRNQVPFVGLPENQVNTNSISAILGGIQFEPFTNFLTTFRANAGLYDYVDRSPDKWTSKNFLSGYALSAGYRSALGPIEISLIYSDQTKVFKGYVNLGFTF